MMRILSENHSKEVKIRLAKKMMVENIITDWITLSKSDGILSEPLWNFARFPNVYGECLIINGDAKEIMFKKFGDFLTEKNGERIYVFPADGWVDGLDFADKRDIVYEKRLIVELSSEELKLIKKARGWGMTGDTYLFSEDMSWLLFICHEGFQVLCSSKEFINDFKTFWKENEQYLQREWSEIFAKG